MCVFIIDSYNFRNKLRTTNNYFLMAHRSSEDCSASLSEYPLFRFCCFTVLVNTIKPVSTSNYTSKHAINSKYQNMLISGWLKW